MRYFVRSGALKGFPLLARAYGANPSKLLRQAGLSTGALHDPDLYIPYPSLAKLLTLAAKACNNPGFGAQLGSRQGLEVVGALGSVMCLQATLADALRMMQHNLDFHARGVRVGIDRYEDNVEIHMQFAFAQSVDCTQLIGLSLALLGRAVSQLHDDNLPPRALELQCPDPGCGQTTAQAAGCPVHFDAIDNQLIYPAHILDIPVTVDAQTRQQLSQQWRQNWQQTGASSVVQQVEHALAALLPTGEGNLGTVARVLNVHPRTLQTQLKTQRSSFGESLRKTRLRLACHHLRNTDIDLTTLALNLGYAELAVFSRSFKQWTGKSPRLWRQEAAEN